MKNLISAILFHKLQSIDFYASLHREVINTFDDSDQFNWIDVGCGPGLITRAAAEKGYKTLGLDINPSSIKLAKKIATQTSSPAIFKCKILEGEMAHVISAASLLAVLPDRKVGLQTLFNAVLPKGTLLIIEPTQRMNIANTKLYVKKHGIKNSFWFYLWAFARQHNIVDDSIFYHLDSKSVEYISMMDGLIGVWKIQKW